jgi:ABC-type Fe3+ transport system permease subunit
MHQELDYDPGGAPRSRISWGAGCLVQFLALLAALLVFFVAGVVAPPRPSRARDDFRRLLDWLDLEMLDFLADTTFTQLVAGLVPIVLAIPVGLVVGALVARRQVKRLPCRQCGAKPLPASGGNPILLTCEACSVVWAVHYEEGGSGDDHHHHHHHHHHFD